MKNLKILKISNFIFHFILKKENYQFRIFSKLMDGNERIKKIINDLENEAILQQEKINNLQKDIILIKLKMENTNSEIGLLQDVKHIKRSSYNFTFIRMKLKLTCKTKK